MAKCNSLHTLKTLFPKLIEISSDTQNSIDRFVPDPGLLLRYIKKPPIYDRSTSASYWYTESHAYTFQPFLESLKKLNTNPSPQEAIVFDAIKDYIESLSILIHYIEDWGELIFIRKIDSARKNKKPVKNYRFPLFEHYKWLSGFYGLKAKHQKIREDMKMILKTSLEDVN